MLVWLFVLALCWQPLYLVLLAVYHTLKGETYDGAAYWSATKSWFSKLLGLVLAKPEI